MGRCCWSCSFERRFSGPFSFFRRVKGRGKREESWRDQVGLWERGRLNSKKGHKSKIVDICILKKPSLVPSVLHSPINQTNPVQKNQCHPITNLLTNPKNPGNQQTNSVGDQSEERKRLTLILRSSTSNLRVALGPMTPPAPRDP